MKFTEVLDDLLNGTKIRRKDWIDGDYIFMDQSEELIEGQDGYGYTLSRDDFNAEWGIYKEPLLTEEEKEILKAILKVYPLKITCFYVNYDFEFDEGTCLKKLRVISKNEKYISVINVKSDYFKKLEINKRYTLEELGL